MLESLVINANGISLKTVKWCLLSDNWAKWFIRPASARYSTEKQQRQSTDACNSSSCIYVRGSKDWWHNSHLIVIEKQPALTAENLCQLLLPRVNYYSILNLLCTLLLCYFYYDIDLYEDSSPKPLYIYFTTQHKGQYTNKNIDCCISNAG